MAIGKDARNVEELEAEIARLKAELAAAPKEQHAAPPPPIARGPHDIIESWEAPREMHGIPFDEHFEIGNVKQTWVITPGQIHHKLPYSVIQTALGMMSQYAIGKLRLLQDRGTTVNLGRIEVGG